MKKPFFSNWKMVRIKVVKAEKKLGTFFYGEYIRRKIRIL